MKPAAEHTFSYVSRGLESSTQLAALSAAAHDLLNSYIKLWGGGINDRPRQKKTINDS